MPGALLLKRPSPLAYPGGNPGFDPSHIASKGVVRFSAIPFGGLTGTAPSAINLLNGKGPSSAINAVTNRISAYGPANNFQSGTQSMLFSGQPTTLPAAVTAASIFMYTGGSGFRCVFSSNSTSGGTGIQLFPDGSGGFFMTRIATGNTSSLIPTPANNVPCMVISSASIAAGKVTYLLKRLDTGQVWTDTANLVIGAGDLPSDGAYRVGDWGGGNLGVTGDIYATMYAENFLTINEMLQWAQDPWAFWYPRTFDLSQMLKGVSGAFLTLTAAQGTFSLSGKAATPNAARSIAAGLGTFAMSGNATTLNRGIRLLASVGAFTLNGNAVTLPRGLTLTAAQGAFTLSGQAATLPRARRITAAPGAFALNGVSASFPAALSIRAVTGAYTISGQGVALSYTPVGGGGASHSLPFLVTIGPLTSR